MKYARFLIYPFIVYIIGIFVFYLFQESIIFQSYYNPDDYRFDAELPHEELYLTTLDSASIHGLLIKSHKPSKGVILYFHGNRGDNSRWGGVCSYFTQFGYDVLVMDYRGYGKSIGQRSEAALHTDARMYYAFLLKKYSSENIIIYGRSLGSGIATKLASEVSAKSLILETPYHNFRNMIFDQMLILPSKNLFYYEFNSEEYIKDVNYPVHIFHGTDDFVIPLESAVRLSHAVQSQYLNYYVINGGSHNDLRDFQEYQEAILEILN
ncbi:MAG: alpha/beta fold hydrolase [Cyclobacteriaceae bacterium]